MSWNLSKKNNYLQKLILVKQIDAFDHIQKCSSCRFDDTFLVQFIKFEKKNLKFYHSISIISINGYISQPRT